MDQQESDSTQFTKEYLGAEFSLIDVTRLAELTLAPFVGIEPRFYCHIQLRDANSTAKTYSSLQAIPLTFSAPVNHFYIDVSSYKTQRSVILDIIPLDLEQRLKLTVKVPEEEASEAHSLVANIEEAFRLQPQPSYDQWYEDKLVGKELKFFAKQYMDKAWFVSAITAIRAHLKGSINFSGDFRVQDRPEQVLVRRDIEQWLADITTEWDRVIATYAWLSSNTLKVTFRCDPKLEMVELRLEAPSYEAVDKLFEELTQNLELELITEEPYRYRRSSANFEIRSWKSENFAEAIEVIVRQFIGDHFVLEEAYVEGGPEKEQALHGFNDLNAFTARLRNLELSYHEVGLRLKGPRGFALGIFVYDDLSRLELKSTLLPKQLAEVVRVFERSLVLKEIEREAASSDASKAPSRVDTFVKFLPIVTLLLGVFVSPAFWGAAFPKDTLRITVPPAQDDKPLRLNVQTVPVEWVLETERWFHTTTSRGSTATVRVLENGLTVVEQRENQLPGTVLELDAGTYDIEVFTEKTGVSDKVRVIIPNQP